MIGPDGSFYAVPLEAQDDAVQHNYKPAVLMKSDTGELHAVPHESVSDALAHKWTVSQSSGAPTEVPQWYGFTPSNIAKNLYEGAKSVVQGAGAVAKDLVQNPNWVEGDNSTLHKFIEQPMLDQSAKAAADLKAGNTTSGVGHAIASGIPMIGPFAASLGEQAGTGDVGGAAAKGAAQILTPMAGGKAIDMVKAGASKLILQGKTPAEAYQSALKPSTTISPARVDNMVQTGLTNEIPVSKAGSAKLASLLEDLQDKVTAEIGGGQGKTIDPHAVATRVDPLKQKFANQVNPDADLQAIDASKEEFLKNNTTPPAVGIGPSNVKPIPAADAQAMKIGTYQQLKGKAYTGELKSATIESQKALARGLKEELASAFPELSNLNAAESKLYDLQPILEKALQRQGNHQLLGIGTPIVAGATKAVTGSSGLAGVAGALKAMVDDPVVKSKLAIYLNKAGVPWSKANAKIQAYSGALAASASDSNSATQDDRGNQ